MKRLLLPLLAVALAVMMFIPAVPSVSGADIQEVKGVLVDRSGDPVEGVTVEIRFRADSTQPYTYVKDPTGPDGSFKIPGVDMDLDPEISIDTEDCDPVGLPQKEGKWFILTRSDLGYLPIMPSTGFITGLVTTESGQPLASVRVEMKGAVTRETFTNSDGKYFIDNIPAGTYTISAARSGFETVRIEFMVTLSYAAARDEVPDLVLKMSSDEYLFGLDLEHSLMVIGLILGIIVVFVSVAYGLQLKRRHDEDR